jgi:Trk K+ transport system NAD-binding subunit
MLDTELRAQRKLWEQSLNAASAAKADAPVVATTSLLTSNEMTAIFLQTMQAIQELARAQQATNQLVLNNLSRQLGEK